PARARREPGSCSRHRRPRRIGSATPGRCSHLAGGCWTKRTFSSQRSCWPATRRRNEAIPRKGSTQRRGKPYPEEERFRGPGELCMGNLPPTLDAPLPDIVGGSLAMRDVYRLTRLVAPTRASVLIVGET